VFVCVCVCVRVSVLSLSILVCFHSKYANIVRSTEALCLSAIIDICECVPAWCSHWRTRWMIQPHYVNLNTGVWEKQSRDCSYSRQINRAVLSAPQRRASACGDYLKHLMEASLIHCWSNHSNRKQPQTQDGRFGQEKRVAAPTDYCIFL